MFTYEALFSIYQNKACKIILFYHENGTSEVKSLVSLDFFFCVCVFQQFVFKKSAYQEFIECDVDRVSMLPKKIDYTCM